MAYLISAGVILSVIIAAEVAARLWIRLRAAYYVWPPGLRLHLQPDPAVLPTLERTARLYVNSDGERGDEFPRRGRPPYRVLVVGGSVPEGLFLDQDSTWPGAMQRILERSEHVGTLSTSGVHVGCVARSGVGSEALALILQRTLPRYERLDAIVIMVGASDVMRWLEAGAPPHPPPVVPVHEVFRVHPELQFAWQPARSALYELVRRLRRQWLKPTDVQPNAGRWIRAARKMRAEALVVHTDAPSPAPMLDHFERCFRDVLERARTKADRVIVVRQPWFDSRASVADSPQVWNGSVGKPWKEHVTTFYALNVLSRLMAMLDARAAAVARDAGAEQVETMSVLDAREEYYYDFVHLTPSGAALVAHAVADRLLRTRAAAPGAQAASHMLDPIGQAERRVG